MVIYCVSCNKDYNRMQQTVDLTKRILLYNCQSRYSYQSALQTGSPYRTKLAGACELLLHVCTRARALVCVHVCVFLCVYISMGCLEPLSCLGLSVGSTPLALAASM